MPFGPNNTPSFYSDMMNKFKDEWDIQFIDTIKNIGTLINEQITDTETNEVFIGDKNIISGSRRIINNILIILQ